MGERQGSALDPLKPFLKEGFKNPKNFQKTLIYMLLKVLGILKGLFQKSLKRVQGRALPLPYKPQFPFSSFCPFFRNLPTALDRKWKQLYNIM